MERVWCSGCGSEISSALHNPNLPLDSFLFEYKEELNHNDIYCSYCSKNKNISEWELDIDIRMEHDSFSEKLYFSPEIINYSPFEFHIIPPRGSSKCKISLHVEDEAGRNMYRHSIEAKKEEVNSYIPPFSKNAIDFNWKYNTEGQDGVINPEISQRYSGQSLTAHFTFHGYLEPNLFGFNGRYSKTLDDVQKLIVENNI